MVSRFQGDAVEGFQRAHGRAVESRGILDQGRVHALGEHALALGDGLADYAGGEETRRILDHDGLLAQLLGQVEGPGQALVGGFLAGDDFHQGHALCRGEEVHADEILGAHGGFGQFCNR